MRVIAGEFRSRRLKALPGPTTRPTPDRLRETLFDILAPRIKGVLFIDGYAGTGAVGIEALSRGARRTLFLEKSRAAVDVIRENVAALGLERRSAVIPGPVLRSLPNHPGDIVFLDPPYEMEGEYRAALELLGENPPPLVIVQHSRRLELQENYAALARVRMLRQGDNALSFYERAE
jgi:16S rRNA (guanine(966)-N(2))-methyltransferase RsmD